MAIAKPHDGSLEHEEAPDFEPPRNDAGRIVSEVTEEVEKEVVEQKVIIPGDPDVIAAETAELSPERRGGG